MLRPVTRTTSRSARRRRPRSSPSIALRARDEVIARSRARSTAANLALLDGFFERQAAHLAWVRPRGGSIGFPELTADTAIDTFAQNLLDAEGVLLAPGSLFGHPGNHFRLGFGRAGFADGLARFEAYVERTLG